MLNRDDSINLLAIFLSLQIALEEFPLLLWSNLKFSRDLIINQVYKADKRIYNRCGNSVICLCQAPRSVHVIQCKSRHFHVLLIIWLHVHVENNTSTGIYFDDKSTMYMYIPPLKNWCIRVVRMNCQVHVHLYLVLNIYVHLFSYLLKCICCNCSHADI